MKNVFLLCVMLNSIFLFAQNKEGVITYTETIKFEIELSDEMKAYAKMLPNEQKTNMDLIFDESGSLYTLSKMATDDTTEELPEDGNIQVETVVIGGGGENVIHINQKTKEVTRLQDMMGQKFLIQSSIEKLPWKLINEEKEILGYSCRKAEYTDEDGTLITVWFAPELPFSYGPATFVGLPGVVLEMSEGKEKVNFTITAANINFNEVSDQIVAPKKGKKVSAEEFEAIVEERMKRMGVEEGGGPVIQIEIDNQ